MLSGTLDEIVPREHMVELWEIAIGKQKGDREREKTQVRRYVVYCSAYGDGDEDASVIPLEILTPVFDPGSG